MIKKKLFIILFCLFFILACNFPFPLIPKLSQPSTLEIPEYSFDSSPTPFQPETSYIQTILSTQSTQQEGYINYYAQSGDTLTVVAAHFGVATDQILTTQPHNADELLPPGELLSIPNTTNSTGDFTFLLPDSEVVYTPAARDFDVAAYIHQKGGYLDQFTQEVSGKLLTGAEIVQLVASNTSVNPRLLLTIIEYRSHWLTSIPQNIEKQSPLSFYYDDYQGFYLECSLAAKWLNTGYYGWRQGLLTTLTLTHGSTYRISPQSNAGSVALQYFFNQLYPQETWMSHLYGSPSFLTLHQSLFGDFLSRSEFVEPLFTNNVTPPILELPFAQGEEWALTGGLHVDWNSGTPSGALDFAPVTGEPACSVSKSWVRASAAGTIIRSSNNIIVIALEDDQGNPTGWELFYMHIANHESVAQGTHVKVDDPIGHPSCQGGLSTGTHVHITRKYKGEWIGASSTFPLILSGWLALPGDGQFKSSLSREGQLVQARQDGSIPSRIFR